MFLPKHKQEFQRSPFSVQDQILLSLLWSKDLVLWRTRAPPVSRLPRGLRHLTQHLINALFNRTKNKIIINVAVSPSVVNSHDQTKKKVRVSPVGAEPAISGIQWLEH